MESINGKGAACVRYSNNDFFKMGAIVAAGELLVGGRLGELAGAVEGVRSFLASFGVRSIADMEFLGVGEHYTRNFAAVFSDGARCDLAGAAR